MGRLLITGAAITATALKPHPAATRDPQANDFVDAAVLINDGQIVAISRVPEPVRHRLDAVGCVVLPGFIDVHVHGGAGHDVMAGTAEALAVMARFLVRHGVTSFLPTTMSADPATTLAAVEAVGRLCPVENGARILGVHLEGPYLSPAFAGAQALASIRPPDPKEFERLIKAGPIRMITLAPEVPGADALIRQALAANIRVVAGHTGATFEQFASAIADGVHQATHTFNAMSGLHHRRPGALGAILSHDEVYAQLIADNVHVHPAAMNILARCKGVDKTILITDAMRASGLGEGEYDLGGQTVTVGDGLCRLADGTLAGSVLTMERGLANFAAAAGLPLAKAWPASSRSAATSLGLSHEIGSIAPGYRADLVVVDAELEVVATIVDGNIVYLRDEARLIQNSG